MPFTQTGQMLYGSTPFSIQQTVNLEEESPSPKTLSSTVHLRFLLFTLSYSL